jgi:transcriptional regulator with XRE-family HTH domain
MTSIRALLASNIKKKRRLLSISQEQLAEKVSTSANYIAQIEQENKFPSPDMIERIAAALEIDTPELFSVNPFSDEAIQQFQDGVLSDLEKAVSQTVAARLAELKNVKPTKKRVRKTVSNEQKQ